MTRCIYIVDDDDAVRASLHGLLSLQFNLVVKSFRDGDIFLRQCPSFDPGVVLLDYQMPGSNGSEVLSTMQTSYPGRFGTVMVTGEGNVALAVQAMKAGALDFIEKPYEPQTLLDVVSTAFTRLEHESSERAHTDQARERIAALSPRERDVLTGLIEGRSNKIIAYELDISPRTVEIYRAHLMTKLGVRSLPEALRIAFAAGMIASR